MAEVNLRAGHPNDAESLLAIHRCSILRLGLTVYSEVQCRSWAYGLTAKGYETTMDAGEKYFVASQQDEIIGFCSYQFNEIKGLFVHPDNARHGIGTALLTRVEADINSILSEEIVLDAALPAVPFYKALGYSTRYISSSLTRGGANIEYHRMFKTAADMPRIHS